jgi:hypothetical protein
LSWFKVDDAFYDHPKVVELTLEAVGLWTLTGAYCARHLTDGMLTARTAQRLGATEELVKELVDAGLWQPVMDGTVPSFQFHDWDAYQPSKESVLKTRAEGKVRAAQSRKKLKERTLGALESNAPTNDERTPPARSPERSPELPANVRQDVQENEQRTSAGRSAPPTRPDPTRPDLPEKPSAPSARDLNDMRFDEVWPSWPKPVDKKDARQKFHVAARKFKGREGELVKAITDHAAAYKATTDTQMVPSLARWLNAERWDNPLPGTLGAAPGLGGDAPRRDPDAWMNPPRRIDRPRGETA